MATTTIQLFNATEMPLTFNNISYDWVGSATSYPTEIGIGQWGEFQHAGDRSAGAVVYRGENAVGVPFDWMVSWDNEYPPLKAYSEVREAGHYDAGTLWSTLWMKLENSGAYNTDKYYFNVGSTVSIGKKPSLASNASSALFAGILAPQSYTQILN